MRALDPSSVRRVAAVLAAAAAAFLVGASSASVSVQTIVVGLVLVLALVGTGPSGWLVTAALVSFCSGLVRRLLAGPSGRIDSDPLVVLPLVLLLLVVVVGFAARRRRGPLDRLTLLVLLVPVAEVAAVVLTGRLGTASLYTLAAQVVPWLVVAGVRTGVVPDVWPTLARLLPGVALVVGLYGVFQFAVLPVWDLRWFQSLQASALGAGKPFDVRIWGMSDSPGPYSALLGACVLVMAHRAVRARAGTQVLWLGAAALTMVPLVLTGVRLALAGLALCVVLLVAGAASGARRLLPLLLGGVTVLLVSRVVGAFGGSSTILTSSRLTSFDPTTDDSVQTRLSLFRLVPQAVAHPFGQAQVGSSDNFVTDVLFTYGPLPAIAVVVVLVALLLAAVRTVRTQPALSAPVVTVFLLVFSLGGNILVSSTGTLAALALGSVALADVRVRPEPPRTTRPEPRTPRRTAPAAAVPSRR